jgi:hypothetical protein
VIKISCNQINRTITRHFCHAYQPTRGNIMKRNHFVHPFFCDNLNWGAYVVSKELILDSDPFVSWEIFSPAKCIVQCLGFFDQFWPPIVPCYSTEDAVQIGNSFITILITRHYNHTIIYYAATRLHNYNPYTFVTTITYYTLALANFSALNYCLELSHTLRLNTSKLSPRSHFANSPLKTPS